MRDGKVHSAYDSSTNRFIQTGSTAVGYDAAGNITQDLKFRGMSYTYDANSRTIGAVGTSAGSIPSTSVYDGVGQRLQSTANDATKIFLYDVFGRLVADYSGVLALENSYIYRGSGQLLAIDNVSNAASGAQNVTWANAVGVSVSGNNLTKTAGTTWGNTDPF